MSKFRKLGIFGSFLILSGCGSSYHVDHLAEESLRQDLVEPGIYYSLPKTQIVLTIPVSFTEIIHSPISNKFDDRVKACVADNNATFNGSQEESKLTLGQVSVFTRAIADPEHRYRLNIEAGPFSTFKHEIKVSDRGLLTSANSTVQDSSAALLLSVARSVAGTLGALGGTPAVAESVIDGQDDGSAECAAISEGQKAVKAADDKVKSVIETVEADRRQILLGSGLAAESGSLEKTLAYLDGLIAKAKENAEKEKRDAGVLPKKVTVRQFLLVGSFEPKKFSDFDSQAPISLPDVTDGWGDEIAPGDDVNWRLLAPNPVVEKNKENTPVFPGVAGGRQHSTENLDLVVVDKLEAVLNEREIRVRMKPLQKYDECTGSACSARAPEGEGYRYRLAAEGKVRVSALDKNSGDGQPRRQVIAEAQVPVAQYGPVARLPAKFDGLEGNVTLGLNKDFGTLMEVSVGAKGQSPQSISDFTKVITDTIQAQRAANAAEDAEEQGAEKQALTNQKELLQLEVDILNLQQQLRQLEAAGS